MTPTASTHTQDYDTNQNDLPEEHVEQDIWETKNNKTKYQKSDTTLEDESVDDDDDDTHLTKREKALQRARRANKTVKTNHINEIIELDNDTDFIKK